MIVSTEKMQRLFRAKPKSFLDAPRRQWQFDAFAWLLRGCGGYPRFLETTLVLPTAEHFPAPHMQGHAAEAALFRTVRDHAGMADWPCIVEPLSGAAPVTSAGGLRVIHYPPGPTAPGQRVAHFAHELARYLVESFDEPPPGGAGLWRPAVDVAAVFLGFGVFMANSSARQTRWHLNEGEWVHALALFCHLRRAPPEIAAPHLDAHVRKYLRLAMDDLAQFEPQLCRLRQVVGGLPDDGDCTLPTRRA